MNINNTYTLWYLLQIIIWLFECLSTVNKWKPSWFSQLAEKLFVSCCTANIYMEVTAKWRQFPACKPSIKQNSSKWYVPLVQQPQYSKAVNLVFVMSTDLQYSTTSLFIINEWSSITVLINVSNIWNRNVKTIFLTKPVVVLWTPVFYRLSD